MENVAYPRLSLRGAKKRQPSLPSPACSSSKQVGFPLETAESPNSRVEQHERKRETEDRGSRAKKSRPLLPLPRNSCFFSISLSIAHDSTNANACCCKIEFQGRKNFSSALYSTHYTKVKLFQGTMDRYPIWQKSFSII